MLCLKDKLVSSQYSGNNYFSMLLCVVEYLFCIDSVSILRGLVNGLRTCFAEVDLGSFLLSSYIKDFENRCDGVVVRASASQSVDLGFIPIVKSHHKALKNGIHSFPTWRTAK